MREFSSMIIEQMADQEISGDIDSNSANGQSVLVQMQWDRNDESEWPDAAQWLVDQYKRMRLLGAQEPDRILDRN